MGSCSFKTKEDKETIPQITPSSFTTKYAIGRGGFGKVWRVALKKEPGQEFAMKEMNKARIITKKSVTSVMGELKLLQ
jgi:serine/threonine protein kinase